MQKAIRIVSFIGACLAILTSTFPSAQQRVLGESLSIEQKSFWKYRCLDTMKYSRDSARAWTGREKELEQNINKQLDDIKGMGANCVALGTPYNEEFVPFLAKWVAGARSRGLAIWFRGNTAEWEGWFGYAKYKNYTDHHAKVSSFITAHPELFANGDIFTPAPEAENGVIGNPWASSANRTKLLDFLKTSYTSCNQAFAKIGKQVACGYFSANGDVAMKMFTQDTIDNTGKRVVVDHYVKSSEQLLKDVEFLNSKFKTPVFVGEFGAPIPSIHGAMDEAQQAARVRSDLRALSSRADIIEGVNYWVSTGGSTGVISENGKPRAAVEAIKDYFMPATCKVAVVDGTGKRLQNVKVSVDGLYSAKTDSSGMLTLVLPAGTQTLVVELSGYKTVSSKITLRRNEITGQTIMLDPSNPSLLYQAAKLLK
jgi:hypothetical protein